MLKILDIKILFCYSPEVLEDTYSNKEQLIKDNKILYQITEDILDKNVNRLQYIIHVKYLDSVEIVNLQKQWGKDNPCLTSYQVDNSF